MTRMFVEYVTKLKRVAGRSLLIRFATTLPRIENIRNVGIVAHIDAGKTTTTENMLFATGAINSVGRVDSGDTVTDFLPQERERGITIQSAAVPMIWKDFQINLIDTPGHVDFTIEVERALRVLDGAIVVLDAVAGVQAQTKKVWSQARKRKIPSIAFVNKMDREGASFENCLSSLTKKLQLNAVPIQYPVGKEGNFEGVIDLLTMSKMTWTTRSSRNPEKPVITPLLEDDPYYKKANEVRSQLLEAIAECDDKFMEIYLEDPNLLKLDDVLVGLRQACISDKIVPVLCGASLRGKGIEPLLDSILAFLPSPADRAPELAVSQGGKANSKEILPLSKDLCALAFKVTHDEMRGPLVFARIFSGVLEEKMNLFNSTKGVKERVNQLLTVHADDLEKANTVHSGNVCCIIGLKNTTTGDTLVSERGALQSFVLSGLDLPRAVYSLSIEPEMSSQQNDLEKVLRILSLEDPSLRFEIDKESGQTLLKGIGELHLEIVCDRIKRQFGINVTTGRAYIAYRESLVPLTSLSKKHIYDKSYGTKRLFAAITYSIDCPGIADDISIKVSENAKKSLAADEYVGLIDGLQGACTRGPMGYPVIGLNVMILEVEKDNDTTPGSIQACASSLIDSCLRSADHTLLEPIMALEIDLPTKFVGDVLSDLTVKKRGFIKEVISNLAGERTSVYGLVPLTTMLGYATSIRSMTHGEGSFSLEFSHLELVDIDVAKQDMQ